ncbi:unnamed protein product, partial [Effrenium voratum]
MNTRYSIRVDVETIYGLGIPTSQTLSTQELEAADLDGYLAFLYLCGVADENGKLEFPRGFPRDAWKSKAHLARALSKRRSFTKDPWTFTVVGLLFSTGSSVVDQLDLRVIDGPEVIIVNPEVILQEPGAQRSATFGEILDKAGAAFWEAAERREPIGSIVFASMVRRGLTDVPQTWTLGTQAPSPLDRHPDLLVAELRIASERACRALGTLVGPATEASKHEEPLLDKTALTWKAWRHQRRLPSDDDWQVTKEYVDVIKHEAEVMQEPRSMRDLAAVHFQGHTEAGIEQNKTLAESYWSKAARAGDVWSAWHATLSHIRDGDIPAAEPYLEVVANSSAAPLKFMALHFKTRLGIGGEKNPVMAGQYLKAAADLGNMNAQLILAHSYMGYQHGNMEGVHPPGGPDKALALMYYKVAALNGRLVPKLNAGLLIAQGADPGVRGRDLQCSMAYRELAEVVHAAYPPAHLLFAHARRAYVLGDSEGSRLRFSLLSDAGFLMAHLNAAWLWEQDARASTPWWHRPNNFAWGRALLYHQRAALSGHAASMAEVSARLRSRSELRSAYRWAALAAELGEARASFDQAYMLQFGLGVPKDEALARKLYEQLAMGGQGWPARVAALSWLGLNAARNYFLRLRRAAMPLVDWMTASTSSLIWPRANVAGTDTARARRRCHADG